MFDCEAVLTVGDGVGTGKVFHYVNGKFDLHQRVYAMTNFSDVSGKYFYYYFKQGKITDLSEWVKELQLFLEKIKNPFRF